MKANAPEKLYISYEGYGVFGEDGSTERTKNSQIEYTRTDAFIEKAARWIEKNLSKYSELTDEDEYENKLEEPVMNVFYGQAVKDFRNYMKGE